MADNDNLVTGPVPDVAALLAALALLRDEIAVLVAEAKEQEEASSDCLRETDPLDKRVTADRLGVVADFLEGLLPL